MTSNVTTAALRRRIEALEGSDAGCDAQQLSVLILPAGLSAAAHDAMVAERGSLLPAGAVLYALPDNGRDL